MKDVSRRILQLVLVILVLAIGVGLTRWIIATKPKIKKTRPPGHVPLVKTMTVKQRPITVEIDSEGTVRPVARITLSPQISGKAVEVSENLRTGKLVRKGELLVKIEDEDYRIALIRAKAEIQKTLAELSRLKEDARASVDEWKSVNPDVPPPPLVAREPDIKAAEAALQAARAGLKKAELDLKRTEIRAPFDAIVINEDVDIGQYLRAGQAIATLASVEEVEIRVFLNEKDAGYLYIPGINTKEESGSEALVSAVYGTKKYTWRGRITRAEPVDEKTRTLPVVVVVKGPYRGLPPLAIGLFVDVKLRGRTISPAVLMPKTALRWDSEGRPFVWVLDRENRLRKRAVVIERTDNGKALISKGLSNGEVVVLSPPDTATEGLKVRVLNK
ncbi:MAG: efflux RND transporter periplasmic adaptor subunit [Nitrospirae bacterium]|nr:efflux RND transporter periplasmic adaptor subunit [Nitrospirota bacterium]